MSQKPPPNLIEITSTESMRQALEEARLSMSERIQNMKERGILPKDYNEN
jgi:hypothetical protein